MENVSFDYSLVEEAYDYMDNEDEMSGGFEDFGSGMFGGSSGGMSGGFMGIEYTNNESNDIFIA